MKLTALIPMLSVSDLKRSIAFYRDRLGFHVINVFGEPEPKWCMIGRDNIKLMLNEPSRERNGDVATACQELSGLLFLPRRRHRSPRGMER